MRFANILAFASLALSVSAAPAPQTTGTAVAPEAPTTIDVPEPEVTMPTLQELLDAFRPVMPSGSSLFYTGGVKLAAIAMQKERKKTDPAHPLLTIKEVWAQNAAGYNDNYWTTITTMAPADAEKAYGRVSSLAFAQATTGDATVLLPSPFDEAKAADSVWVTVEKPEIKKSLESGAVTSLTMMSFSRPSFKVPFTMVGSPVTVTSL